MAHIVLPESSDEWVLRYLDSDEDPTTLTPEVVMLNTNITPTDLDPWTTAYWAYTPARQNRHGDYRSQVKFKVGTGALDLTAGYYNVWLRLTGGDVSPVISIGTVTITSSTPNDGDYTTPLPANRITLASEDFTGVLGPADTDVQVAIEKLMAAINDLP